MRSSQGAACGDAAGAAKNLPFLKDMGVCPEPLRGAPGARIRGLVECLPGSLGHTGCSNRDFLFL